MKEAVTIEKLNAIDNVYDAIKWAQEQREEYPQRPAKPSLPQKHTSIEAKKYVLDLEAYEKQKQQSDNEMKLWREEDNKINSVIVEYIKEMAGLENVPEPYKNTLYEKAYQDAHSDGYYSVYQKLESLIEIFE